MSEHIKTGEGSSTPGQKNGNLAARELRRLAGKIIVAALVLEFLLGFYVAIQHGTILSFAGLGVAVLIPYFLLSIFAPKSKWNHISAIAGLSALALLIFYQSDGQPLFFLLFFIASGIAVMGQDQKACLVPVAISFVFFVTVSNIEGTNGTGVSNPDILYYNIFLLGFAGICFLISRFLLKVAAKERTLAQQVEEFRSKSETSINYAKQIAAGNLNAEYDPEEGDTLGQSLLEMSNNLRKAAEIERERTWQIEGIAKLHELLRHHNTRVEDLSYQIILFLVKYLDANQGGAFVLNEEDEKEPFLELKACYAYSRQKFLQKKVELGEGLLGQAYLEKDIVYLTDVPQDYFMIKSGLGDATPTSVILVPLKTEDKVVGVLEIASFQELPPYRQEFLLKASESIASSITTMKINEQTSRLLAESQEMAEEMRAQEEEMRQNMEELHATQEDLHRKNLEQKQAEEELKESQVFLNEVLNSIPAPICVKNRNHEVILFNTAYKEKLEGVKTSRLAVAGGGTLLMEKDELRDEDEQIFLAGGSVKGEKKMVDKSGLEKYYLTTKAVFNNNKGEEFLINVLTDITDRKEFEEALALERLMFQSLMDNFPDRINFKNKEGQYLRVNRAKAKRHGLDDPSLIIGKSDFDFFKEEHARKAFNEELEIMKSSKGIIDLEEKLLYPDGSIAWGSTSKMPLIDGDGNIIGTYGITRDITEQKKVQFTIENLKEIIATLSETVPVLLYKIDKDKAFTEFSGSGAETIGVKPEAVIGSKATSLFPYEKHLGKEMQFLHKGKTGEKEWTFQHRLFEDKNLEGGVIGFAVMIG